MAIPGKNQFFSLDDSGGTPVDLSAYLTGVDLSREFGLEDSTTLGDTGHEFTPTLSNGTINIPFFFHATLEAHMAGLFGLAATSTFAYGPDTNTAGKRKVTGECRLQSIQTGGEVAGLVQGTVTLQIDGAISHTTF